MSDYQIHTDSLHGTGKPPWVAEVSGPGGKIVYRSRASFDTRRQAENDARHARRSILIRARQYAEAAKRG